jgi:hypothetical protein
MKTPTRTMPPPSDDAFDDVDIINIVKAECHGGVSPLFPPG